MQIICIYQKKRVHRKMAKNCTVYPYQQAEQFQGFFYIFGVGSFRGFLGNKILKVSQKK